MKKSQAILRLRQVIRRQHKALATEDSYVFWVRRYISSLLSVPPDLPSERKLEIFLTGLALRHNVAASTQNQAFNAVLFFYKEVLRRPLGNVDALRAKRPVHQRHAPSVTDTRQLLEAVTNVGGYPTNLVARLLYGCGLRVSEPCKKSNPQDYSTQFHRARPTTDSIQAALNATLSVRAK